MPSSFLPRALRTACTQSAGTRSLHNRSLVVLNPDDPDDNNTDDEALRSVRNSLQDHSSASLRSSFRPSKCVSNTVPAAPVKAPYLCATSTSC